MRSMTGYRQWDIILVQFPFTDFKSAKKRPALVISPDKFNKSDDLIIAFMTSQMDRSPQPGDYQIEDWKGASLPKPSLIRMKLATISKSIVHKKLGRLSQIDINAFKSQFVSFFIGK